jgi:hypothetical protein
MLSGIKPKHLVFVLVGIVAGLALGLFFTWQLWPVEYYDTDPVDLRAQYKDDYVVMIAAAYAQDSDLGLASFRLGELGLGDSKQVVLGLFQRYRDAGYVEETQSLAQLAYDLGVTDVALLPYMQQPTATPSPVPSPQPTATESPTTAPVPTVTPLPATPTATERPAEPSATATEPPPTPTATEPAPIPTRTATSSPQATSTPTVARDFDYQLVEQKDLGCTADGDGDYILVYVRDENDHGLAGVELVVKGPDVEDTFYTGLKPEIDAGFADFKVDVPGIYTIQVAGTTSQIGQGLSFDNSCEADAPHREWQVLFRRVSR